MSVDTMEYNASPIGKLFHASNAFVRGVRGPVGSGKSSLCAIECLLRAMKQEPAEDGWRYTRFAVIRNTYPELESTTIKTWKMWYPEEHFGPIKKVSPITHHVRMVMSDDVKVDMEVFFIACDKPGDTKKLLSLELTGAWLNEARELPYEILSAATERVRRFPPPKMGGATWCGVWMDTNSMEEFHWWAQYEKCINEGHPPPAGYTVPKDWEFWAQPPAVFEKKLGGGRSEFTVNPEAENIQYLNKGYYENMWQGKNKSRIRIMLGNQFGTLSEGEGVYEQDWNTDIHLAPEPIKPELGHKVIVGVDSTGLHPAAVFSQFIHGQWRDLDEVVTDNTAADAFAGHMKRKMSDLDAEAGGRLVYSIWGDPAGANRMAETGKSFHMIMRLYGIPIRDVGHEKQGISDRIEAGRRPLNRMIGGSPGYVCSPRCRMLIAGFSGNYCYAKKPKAMTQFDLKDTPEKNIFSHVQEARQYGYIENGEWAKMQGTKKPRVRKAERRYSLDD